MKKKGKSKVKNKELENSITGKFMEVVHGLGHDAEKLKKEIAKAGKAVSQKISSALKDAQKALTKADDKKEKPAKKDGKKKGSVKTEAIKADAKTEKVISKAASGKVPTVSSRSVTKPVVPAIDQSLTPPDPKTEVKEASAPVKRKRAPRRTKEEIETAKSGEKAPVKEASAPVKRKRAPRKPKPAPNNTDKNQASENTNSAVL